MRISMICPSMSRPCEAICTRVQAPVAGGPTMDASGNLPSRSSVNGQENRCTMRSIGLMLLVYLDAASWEPQQVLFHDLDVSWLVLRRHLLPEKVGRYCPVTVLRRRCGHSMAQFSSAQLIVWGLVASRPFMMSVQDFYPKVLARFLSLSSWVKQTCVPPNWLCVTHL